MMMMITTSETVSKILNFDAADPWGCGKDLAKDMREFISRWGRHVGALAAIISTTPITGYLEHHLRDIGADPVLIRAAYRAPLIDGWDWHSISGLGHKDTQWLLSHVDARDIRMHTNGVSLRARRLYLRRRGRRDAHVVADGRKHFIVDGRRAPITIANDRVVR